MTAMCHVFMVSGSKRVRAGLPVICCECLALAGNVWQKFSEPGAFMWRVGVTSHFGARMRQMILQCSTCFMKGHMHEIEDVEHPGQRRSTKADSRIVALEG